MKIFLSLLCKYCTTNLHRNHAKSSCKIFLYDFCMKIICANDFLTKIIRLWMSCENHANNFCTKFFDWLLCKFFPKKCTRLASFLHPIFIRVFYYSINIIRARSLSDDLVLFLQISVWSGYYDIPTLWLTLISKNIFHNLVF